MIRHQGGGVVPGDEAARAVGPFWTYTRARRWLHLPGRTLLELEHEGVLVLRSEAWAPLLPSWQFHTAPGTHQWLLRGLAGAVRILSDQDPWTVAAILKRAPIIEFGGRTPLEASRDEDGPLVIEWAHSVTSAWSLDSPITAALLSLAGVSEVDPVNPSSAALVRKAQLARERLLAQRPELKPKVFTGELHAGADRIGNLIYRTTDGTPPDVVLRQLRDTGWYRLRDLHELRQDASFEQTADDLFDELVDYQLFSVVDASDAVMHPAVLFDLTGRPRPALRPVLKPLLSAPLQGYPLWNALTRPQHRTSPKSLIELALEPSTHAEAVARAERIGHRVRQRHLRG